MQSAGHNSGGFFFSGFLRNTYAAHIICAIFISNHSDLIKISSFDSFTVTLCCYIFFGLLHFTINRKQYFEKNRILLLTIGFSYDRIVRLSEKRKQNGVWLSLVERLVRDQEAGSSNLLTPIKSLESDAFKAFFVPFISSIFVSFLRLTAFLIFRCLLQNCNTLSITPP